MRYRCDRCTTGWCSRAWFLMILMLAVGMPACAKSLLPAFQDRPPVWAVGTFRGVNRKYRNHVEVTITDRGEVRVRTTDERGNTSRAEGGFRGERITVDNNTYRVEQIFRGIRIVQENDPANWMNLSRISGEGGYGELPARGDHGDELYYRRPPVWALGTFRGYNRKYQNDVELTLSSNGRVTARLTEISGRVTRQSGQWRNGRIELGSRVFDVERSGDGMVLTEVGDRSHRILLTRGNALPWGEEEGDFGRPPAWLVGTFEAYNEEQNCRVEMTVDRNGRVTTRVIQTSGRVSTLRGIYRHDRIEQDGKRYEVSRVPRGVILTEVGNRWRRYTYRRVD
ncbi:MAG: hypothetical protein RMJ43_01980 [Chloroherpetonaceae bacterium]|nr:hypothetical protein [Chthonomonadaceae bacterium]MDW8206576.1 hypothetical protein [Chloroherpetonaceae bacterium]